jgi:hypothetical protein
MIPLIDTCWIDWNWVWPIQPSLNTSIPNTVCVVVLHGEHPPCQRIKFQRTVGSYQLFLPPALIASAYLFQSKTMLSCSCLFFFSYPDQYFETVAQSLSSFKCCGSCDFNIPPQRGTLLLNNSSTYWKSSSLVIFFCRFCSSSLSKYCHLPCLL